VAVQIRDIAVSGSEHADALHQVCHPHSSVLHPPAEGGQSAADDSSKTEIVADFPPERDSPGHARRLVARALRQWGHDNRLVEDATLVLSELATNAVVHAGSPFSVAVRVKDSVLHVAVRDATPLAATARDNGLVPRTGHGLGLIDVLSTHWGVEAMPGGKIVWAELPYQRPADTQLAPAFA
jgi:anti-sigma regulatory factor (Ser/Thr protein kinase)